MFNNLPHFDMSPILSQLGLESDPRGGNRTRTLPSGSGSDWSLFANELFFFNQGEENLWIPCYQV